MSDSLKLWKTEDGWVVESERGFHRLPSGDPLGRENLYGYLKAMAASSPASPSLGGGVLAPIENQEVWAAGVTYFRSRTARMEESKSAGGGDFYDRVYHAERPELFYKASGRSVVAPGAAVRIRSDSKWNIPEPELTLVVSPAGRINGYTIGNDMSSRDIEGANPLYLPQAKVYDGSCALGPAILVTSEALPKTTSIGVEILRSGEPVFQGATTLAGMKREPPELVGWLFRERSFPEGCFLLTGTGVVPPDEFTLRSGDVIRIAVDNVGVLENPVG
jgi:2-dehydro-3-deoxy-D-arabinonate dehydratase